MKTRMFTIAALVALAAAPALARPCVKGDITVDKAWARATPKGATVGAAYFVIHNNGASADRFTGGSADFAGALEVHEMGKAGGIMTMRRLDGLEIPAKGEVALTPGHYHLMFQGLKRRLVKGETLKATLDFQHAGALSVEFPVAGIGAMGPMAP